MFLEIPEAADRWLLDRVLQIPEAADDGFDANGVVLPTAPHEKGTESRWQ